GAYVLAGELALHDDARAAYDAYERAMRPMVDQAQGIPKFGPRLLHPRTRAGITVLHRVLAVATRPALIKLFSRVFASRPKTPDLTRYGALPKR
ncbi:MAG: FAD-binding monooxygenase, partial [Luteimonas sp.]